MTTRAADEGTQAESRPQLLFVIPAFNEEENLPNLFADLAQTSDLLGDGLADLHRRRRLCGRRRPSLVESYSGPLPVELVRLEVNQGPGAAFRTGFASALQCADPDALIVTLEADTTGDLGALPQMLDEVRRGADVVLADWRMVGVSAHRRLLSAAAGWVVRHSLGLEATTVSSFFRVYRASTLQDASTRYGERLIRERGFACKAELLAKLAAMNARIVEVPVSLDWSKRNGESKMPVFKTMLAYWRMLFRAREGAPEPIPAAPEGALGA